MKEIITYTDPADPRFGTTVEIDHPDPPTVPQILSKTAFQDYAVSQLGAGTTGMARFQAIMDAAEVASGAVKFCFSRYEAANTFAKDQVDAFTQIMVAATIMSATERSNVLTNWPTG